MTVYVQTEEGLSGANSYVTLGQFKSYHDARGNAYPDNDETINAMIIKGRDYLDTRYVFKGVKKNGDQGTQWPRVGKPRSSGFPLYDADENRIDNTIPPAIMDAQCEYALRAEDSIYKDTLPPEGGVAIQSQTNKVDVIEQSTTYVTGGSNAGTGLPVIPAADLILARAGLIEIGKTLYR